MQETEGLGNPSVPFPWEPRTARQGTSGGAPIQACLLAERAFGSGSRGPIPDGLSRRSQRARAVEVRADRDKGQWTWRADHVQGLQTLGADSSGDALGYFCGPRRDRAAVLLASGQRLGPLFPASGSLASRTAHPRPPIGAGVSHSQPRSNAQRRQVRTPEPNRLRERGHDAAWGRLSTKARRLQPWCEICGMPGSPDRPGVPGNPLNGDHIRWPARSLADVRVLCRRCNSKAGAARSLKGQT